MRFGLPYHAASPGPQLQAMPPTFPFRVMETNKPSMPFRVLPWAFFQKHANIQAIEAIPSTANPSFQTHADSQDINATLNSS